ncbi:MAG: AmmeMemoRadiSam system protein B [Gammaproteobacteria bacterium]|nr:AmmeMemoRadiSam system protein B [Gammaproteobacteria bacterium]
MNETVHQIRLPAVAGMFYPADRKTLNHDIQHYLKLAQASHPALDIKPKAIIVPHAGYIFSAAIAASAYQYLIPHKHKINRVVLLGPCHRTFFKGLALPASDAFNTPLGNIPVDQAAGQLLSGLDQVIISEQAHTDEHSLEVQLPFLQSILDHFSLIPLVVGDASQQEVAEVLERLWGDEQTLIVLSTDLSHYHDYHHAKQLDRSTSDAIANLKPELIGYEDACGRNGLKGVLSIARQKQLSVDILDIRNSGDTAGDKNRVVGYGAYAIH